MNKNPQFFKKKQELKINMEKLSQLRLANHLCEVKVTVEYVWRTNYVLMKKNTNV